ncbi:MAG: sigma-70 family RNA polymerase sigma factor [Cyanothece sp. SIO2G6]|nr:sigma-70 family RNA polymerase sigma factor [Cyanothece sp. SIO2G6]
MARISSNLSDVELIHGLRSGEQEALAVLYDRYGNLVYTVALKILKRSDEAEDLTQDVFLNFWKKETFDPNRAALSTYLCVMTRSRALNRISSQGSRQRQLQQLQYVDQNRPTVTPLEEASLAEQQSTLRQALSTLPERQRQILELNFYQGSSHSEIARQLDLPLGTVKSSARQGLLKLRKVLGDRVK